MCCFWRLLRLEDFLEIARCCRFCDSRFEIKLFILSSRLSLWGSGTHFDLI